jgi:hypothetical protein
MINGSRYNPLCDVWKEESMIYIAHRGLMYGPNPTIENSPIQISLAIEKGFDVEVDIWYIDETWYLGHDGPKYIVDSEWIFDNAHYCWFHCKNESAFIQMNGYCELPHEVRHNVPHYFWHTTDKYTFTSEGWPWVFPGEKVFKNSIWVLPEYVIKEPSSKWWNIRKLKETKCRGYCSDWIYELKEYTK